MAKTDKQDHQHEDMERRQRGSVMDKKARGEELQKESKISFTILEMLNCSNHYITVNVIPTFNTGSLHKGKIGCTDWSYSKTFYYTEISDYMTSGDLLEKIPSELALKLNLLVGNH